MTILLAHCTAERALVAVDTLAIWPADAGRPPTEWSKLVVLPQLGAVVAVSGETDLLGVLFQSIVPLGSFDAVLDAVRAGLLERSIAAIRKLRAQRQLDTSAEHLIVLAGYSTKHARYVGAVVHDHASDGARRGELDYVIAPPLPAPSTIRPDNLESMLSIARRQIAASPIPLGGRLLLAELHRGVITCSAHALAWWRSCAM